MEEDLLNLKKFKIERKLFKGEKCKYYEIFNLEKKTQNIAKTPMLDIQYFSREKLIDYSREVYINSKVNHPSILKFFGYSLNDFKERPKPVIITENASNGTLYSNIHQEKTDDINNLDDTKKLIIIFGIASGLAYLHSHNIIHRNLNSKSIFLDEFYYPKITNFDFSKQIEQSSFKNESTIKGKLKYVAPETLVNFEYSKSTDVYSFSLLIYEIMTNKKPFKNINESFKEEIFEGNEYEIKRLANMTSIILDKGIRPEFNASIPDSYRKLIEKCWSQNPKMRPTFDEIVTELKTNPDFITDKINKEEYQKYINFIEKSNVSFLSLKKSLKLMKF